MPSPCYRIRCPHQLTPHLFFSEKFAVILFVGLLLSAPASGEDVVKDYFLSGAIGGAAYYFSAGEHAWDASRIQITETYTIQRLRVRMRRVDCSESGAGCVQGGERLRPYFNARIYSHDPVNGRPGMLIGSVSSNTINFNTDINSSTTSVYDSTTPFVDVWFNDLNTAVSPGLYWIVIHNVNWANLYPNHLDHFIQIDATNMAPLGGGPLYGRALSYTSGNTENTMSWAEKYTGQVKYALYAESAAPGAVYTIIPQVISGNGTISPVTAQKVEEGAQATFTIASDSGSAATVGGTCGGSLAGTVYTTNPVYADCTITVSFSPILHTHTVTPTSGANGNISPATSQKVNDGSRMRFTVTPNRGYAARVGGTCGGRLVGTVYTTKPVYADCTVVARFIRRW